MPLPGTWGQRRGGNWIFFYNKKEIFFYVKILTEGVFKNVINTSVLEPEGHHSKNFQARRVENWTAGRSELCTGASPKFINPPESARQNYFDHSTQNFLYGKQKVTLTPKGNSSDSLNQFYMSHFSIYRSSLITTKIDYYTAVFKQQQKTLRAVGLLLPEGDAMFNSQGREDTSYSS